MMYKKDMAALQEFVMALKGLSNQALFALVKTFPGAAGKRGKAAEFGAALYSAICAEAEDRGYWKED